MTYKVIVGHSPEDLEFKINALLKNGWTLAGGLAIGISSALSAGILIDPKGSALVTATEYGNNLIYCQAVIKPNSTKT